MYEGKEVVGDEHSWKIFSHLDDYKGKVRLNINTPQLEEGQLEKSLSN